jgi:biopolymer transport protein ExbB/TolQ
MKCQSLVARPLQRNAAVAPAISGMATVYGLYSSSNSLQASDPTWRTVAGGITHALAASAILTVSVVLYSLVAGRGDNESAWRRERAGMGLSRVFDRASAGRSAPGR